MGKAAQRVTPAHQVANASGRQRVTTGRAKRHLPPCRQGGAARSGQRTARGRFLPILGNRGEISALWFRFSAGLPAWGRKVEAVRNIVVKETPGQKRVGVSSAAVGPLAVPKISPRSQFFGSFRTFPVR